jgi:hypothetical protein
MIKDISVTDSSEPQSEIAALYCFAGAPVSTLPLSSKLRLWPAFESLANQSRVKLDRMP